ncbi:MAG: multicopper oxidase domain-containing protein [Methylococcaceae bacterium]|nr:multicopper oxidase domain-containing protein [Methylococcaceae bacterium]
MRKKFIFSYRHVAEARCQAHAVLNPPASRLAVGISVALGLLVINAGSAQAAGILKVPSGLEQPSPLFGAKPFSTPVVLFEEFGLQDYKDSTGAPREDSSKMTLPPPIPPITREVDCTGAYDSTDALGNYITDAQGNTYGDLLDGLIKNKGLYPLPSQLANAVEPNPWSNAIKTCIPGTAILDMMPMDGRPNGEDFKHQRWSDFSPQKFFQAIMAGARTSGGARDRFQSHGYDHGKDGATGAKIWSEFGWGGLYHNTVTSPYATGGPLNATLTTAERAFEASSTPYIKKFEGTTKGIDVAIHPLMPVQDKNSVWTFDGTIPAKLLMARYGETILFRHHNALPLELGANNGFGTHTISTHEHNGHNPAESDGFAGAFFYPGQFYDYHWPMVLAGHDSINTAATDKRAAMPCEPGEVVNGATCPASGSIPVPGDYRETMSTHWFHDHMLDFTAQNVYKGNAAMMNYYSAIDRGNETFNDGINLKFPSGSARSWGNRDYDVNLVLGDKAFDQSGQLYFNPLITDGFLGDVMTVNWVYKPYLDVRARKYRFRILNGSVSRYFKIAVVDEKGAQVPFHLIANDGNILQHSVAFPNAASGQGLPTQSIAERYDIIVDFAPLYAKGIRKVYLVNLMEHSTGAGPKTKPITVAAAFDAFNTRNKNAYNDVDLAIGKFMEFRLRPLPAGQVDVSMNPAEYTETVLDPKTKKSVPGKVMLPLPTFTAAELASAKHRTFIYGKKPDIITDGIPWTIATDGGEGLTADIDRISAAPTKNSVEIWHLTNNAGGWAHPAHIHFEEGQIIARNGVAPPPWEKFGRKDMYRLGPEINSSTDVDVAIRVRDFTGTYVQHCHNTQHEDHAMLLRWDSEDADHAKWVRTPYPDWDGPHYDEDGLGKTYKLPTADTGSTDTTRAKQFILPRTFGQRAADVPVTSAPNP